MRRYVLDTNLYIEADRHEPHARAFIAFVAAYLPFIYLSAVVVQELLAGARTPAYARQIEADVIAPYERVGRVITPSYRSFKRTGEVLNALIRSGVTLARTERGFVNDVLLATSCVEQGLTLVTRNTRDFERIGRHLRGFAFVPPYPASEATNRTPGGQP